MNTTFYQVYGARSSLPKVNLQPIVVLKKPKHRKSRFVNDTANMRAQSISLSQNEMVNNTLSPKVAEPKTLDNSSEAAMRSSNIMSQTIRNSTTGRSSVGLQSQSLNFVNLSKVRQSRGKIESDVQLLQNRIHLLEEEEKRAMRVIEETKGKAEQILQNRQDNAHLRKSLESARRSEMRSRAEIVRQRNESASTQGVVSGSVALARQSVQVIKEAKHEEAIEFRRMLKHDIKKKERKAMKALHSRQRLTQEVRGMEVGLKSLYESVYSSKLSKVREMKAEKVK